MESMLYVNGEFVCDSEEVVDPGPENVELVPCQICTRTFAPSALEKHVGICEKMHVQRRTPFDSFRQRREGTGLETYLPSNYGLIVKPKTSKLASPTDARSVSRSISSVYDASNTSTIPRRVTPTRTEAPKLATQETPLQRRSMRKQSLGPINEVCPHCGRSFGSRAFDRHVEWCAEKCKITQPTLSAQQHLAKERMQARTKYKAPSLSRSKREKNREKYSSLSESMNNLSDGGGISIMDFNSVADPYERGRKSSIMSLSMTSSIASDGGFSDKYDPFISAKRQLEDLFNSSGINATSTPSKGSSTGATKMTTSLTTAKSPSSPTKTPILSKSNFRRSSSLRVPSKKTSPISFMPKYKPTIQRGISDEGPISSNFLKPEEYDELPVKSHAVIPPDLVPKSPKPVLNRDQPPPTSTPTSLPQPSPAPTSLSPQPSPLLLLPSSSSSSSTATAQSPVVVKRAQPNTLAIRRNMQCYADLKGPNDFPLTKTDSLAAFLKFEDDVECMDSGDEKKQVAMSEKELKDKSNNLNKKSFTDRFTEKHNQHEMTNEMECSEFGDFSGNDEPRLPAIDSHKTQQNKNSISLASIEKPLIKHKIVLEPLTANLECNNNINHNNVNNNDNNHNHNNISNNHNNRIDENDNSIDSNLINSCDNLRISNLSKLLNNESSSFDQSLGGGNYDDDKGGGDGDGGVGAVSESTTITTTTTADTSIQNKQNQLITKTIDSNQSTRDSSSADSLDTHQHMERIANLKNINDTNDKRINPKRQLQLHKASLLFDNVMATASMDDIDDNGDGGDSNSYQTNDQFSDTDTNQKTYSSNESSPKSQTNSRLSNIDESNGMHSSRKLSASDPKSSSDRQDIESLFEDFDLEEFISSFSDNEQFPIFKNYKQMLESNGRSTSARTQHGSESTSEESEFDYKYETSDFDTSERERTLSANSFSIGSGREKAIDQFNSLEFKEKQTSFDEKPLKRPDVTVEAEKRMQIESEQRGQPKCNRYDTKLDPMQEIFNENDEMSEAERDLLTSVQELSSMCEDSNTLDLTSCISAAQKDESPVRLEASFKSLFLRSPTGQISDNGSIRFNQRHRHQSILSYQMPEIVGLTTPSAEKDFNRLKPTSPHEQQFSGKTDGTKSFKKESTKLNSPLNGFDRVLPPIILHKNDSQNIYNTINMTPSYQDGSMTSRSDSLLTNSAVNDRKLSTSSLVTTAKMPNKDGAHHFNAMKMSKFCHECGAKFIVEHAKFCMDCGAKRAVLD